MQEYEQYLTRPIHLDLCQASPVKIYDFTPWVIGSGRLRLVVFGPKQFADLITAPTAWGKRKN